MTRLLMVPAAFVLLLAVLTGCHSAVLLQRLVPTQIPGSTFGYSMASNGDRVVIAAPTIFLISQSAPAAFGAFFGYNVTGNGLMTLEQTVLNPPTAVCANHTNFGLALSASADVLAVGAPASSRCPGSVYLYNWNETGVFSTRSIQYNSSGTGDGFGSEV
jgi:hypothetical protein